MNYSEANYFVYVGEPKTKYPNKLVKGMIWSYYRKNITLQITMCKHKSLEAIKQPTTLTSQLSSRQFYYTYQHHLPLKFHVVGVYGSS